MKTGTKILLGLAVAIIGIIIFLLSRTSSQTVQKPAVKEPDQVQEAKVLAKGASQYLEFSQPMYEKALSGNKIVYLEFYANWCPICRAQETDLIEGFKNLKRADVVGFRVNYKDDQTDEFEKALAEKYKIPYQHHKIVLKDGKVAIDTADSWDSEALVTELSEL